jgi:hypothetical protein
MNRYTVGQLVQLNISLTGPSGALVDPTAITLDLVTPDQAVHALTPTRVSTGIYYAQFPTTMAGLHQYLWQATGAAAAGAAGGFIVNQEPF